MAADPADDAPTDWFGNPLAPRRDPVPCPRCGAPFTDSASFTAHLAAVHAERADIGRPPPPAARRAGAPALGRNARSPLAMRLRRTPLALVVAANIAAILLVVAVLGALAPPWWEELRSQSWGGFVVVPMLWPTVGFLLVRGID